MAGITTLEDLIGIEHGKLGFYQELQHKVDQLRKSNLELEEKREENQALLDGITDLMLVLTDDLVVQRVNHVFESWYPGVDPIGLTCHQVLRGTDEPCENCPVIKALETNEVSKDLVIHKVEDRYRHYEILVSPLKRESHYGKRQVLVFKRDVTLEKEYQAQFYQAEKMATVGTLAAGVAHEINNPLAAISGFAEGLKRRITKIESQIDEKTSGEFKEYTDTIINECLRCRDIVQTLLTFSRPVAASLGSVDLNKCVTDTLFILKHHFKKEHRVKIYTELADQMLLIRGDESQLKQVIINLLTNAYHATDDLDEIRIYTSENSDGGAELVIEDNGCGIPQDELGKLFEPFYTTKPVGEGVGIGLATCYNIVQRHQGEITVESTLGIGSMFKVTLPGFKRNGR